MAALTRIVAPLLALALLPVDAHAQDAPPSLASAPAMERWHAIIAAASQRFGVPQAWIAAVMKAESRGHTHLDGRPIVSRAGAMGLMQVMPGTWAAMRQHGLGDDPHDPRDNVMAGTAYLRAMYDRFGYPGLFAAYNAGPARYAEHLRGGRPLPPETRSYIRQVAQTPANPSMPLSILSGTRLFFVLGNVSTAADPASRNTKANAILVPRDHAAQARK